MISSLSCSIFEIRCSRSAISVAPSCSRNASMRSSALIEAVHDGVGLFVREVLCVVLDHIRQPEDGRDRSGIYLRSVPCDAVVLGDAAELGVVCVESCRVDVDRSRGAHILVADEGIDLTPEQPFPDSVSDIVLERPVYGRQFDREVELLAVERADFDGYFFCVRARFLLCRTLSWI